MCLKPENRTKEELAEQILKDTKELIDIAKESKPIVRIVSITLSVFCKFQDAVFRKEKIGNIIFLPEVQVRVVAQDYIFVVVHIDLYQLFSTFVSYICCRRYLSDFRLSNIICKHILQWIDKWAFTYAIVTKENKKIYQFFAFVTESFLKL